MKEVEHNVESKTLCATKVWILNSNSDNPSLQTYTKTIYLDASLSGSTENMCKTSHVGNGELNKQTSNKCIIRCNSVTQHKTN